MYAEQRYVPRTARAVSLSAAIGINGLILAGFLTMVPNFVVKPPPGAIDTINIPIQPPPPPVPVEKPIVEPQPQTLQPYIPPTPLPMPDQPAIRSTDTLPTELPPAKPVDLPPGPSTVEPAKPVAALIGAQTDPRFARDFQPDYPSAELRAQRDGRVSVRVLIGADGRVKVIEQLGATSSAFFEATRRQALSKWRFKPATRGGVPEESWKTMTVRFELKNL